MISNRLQRHTGLLATCAILMVASPALMSCALVSPVTEHRGYIVNEADLKKIEPKVTTKAEVQRYMGSPSTVSTIDGEAWYYISSTTETFLYHEPEEVARSVIAVYFDKTSTVQDLVFYGLKDGQVVNLETRITPTRGKELTILGQLFSNFGRFNKTDDKKPGVTPGGH
jgi:outer membrane protein assembly factor BamE (lipoprotein component of BamABCDE complex)